MDEFYNHRRPQQAMNNQRPTVMLHGGLNEIDWRPELRVGRFAQATQTHCAIPTVKAGKPLERWFKKVFGGGREKKSGLRYNIRRPRPTDQERFDVLASTESFGFVQLGQSA